MTDFEGFALLVLLEMSMVESLVIRLAWRRP
jgi:hypothetical protein